MHRKIWLSRDGLQLVVVDSLSRRGKDVRFWRIFDGPGVLRRHSRGRFEGIFSPHEDIGLRDVASGAALCEPSASADINIRAGQFHLVG